MRSPLRGVITPSLGHTNIGAMVIITPLQIYQAAGYTWGGGGVSGAGWELSCVRLTSETVQSSPREI